MATAAINLSTGWGVLVLVLIVLAIVYFAKRI